MPDDVEITDETVGKIAHILTGAVNSTCCHTSGGYGGQHAHPNCDCRDAARQVIAALAPLIAKQAHNRAVEKCARECDERLNTIGDQRSLAAMELRLVAAALRSLKED